MKFTAFIWTLAPFSHFSSGLSLEVEPYATAQKVGMATIFGITLLTWPSGHLVSSNVFCPHP